MKSVKIKSAFTVEKVKVNGMEFFSDSMRKKFVCLKVKQIMVHTPSSS